MSHHDEHENLTVADFFEEYGMIVFFGGFFLLTMFVPLLFLPDLRWMFWGIVAVIVAIAGLMGSSVYLGLKHKK